MSDKNNENKRWKRKAKKKKNKDRKEKEDREAFSERVRAKWFCCAFKLGFLQLICQVSLIVNSNLELALSTIFKQRELCETKHVVMEYRYLKIWDLLSFFICSSILVWNYS